MGLPSRPSSRRPGPSWAVALLLGGCWIVSGGGAAGAAEPVATAPAAAGTVKAADRTSTRPKILLDVEKPRLKLGFIKLTDCAPLVIAKEKGFFAEEGLSVELESQPNWKTLLDRVISGELDGAHMLSGQPLAATIGIGTRAEIITAYTLDLNGNAITVGNRVWERMQAADPALDSPTPPHPITAAALVPLAAERVRAGTPLRMATVFPVSTHNYELRYWLAAAGIHPGFYTATDLVGETGAEVLLSVTPPPQMPSTLEAGTIQGYCVGEPWNQQAVAKGIGVPVVTNYDIRKNKPEKVFGVSEAWNDAHPRTHIAVIKALLQAGRWLDATDAHGRLVHREEASRVLSDPRYVGADYEVIKSSMTGTFLFQASDRRALPDFNVFYRYQGTYPWISDGVWFLTQMRRWGQITEAKDAAWYDATARKVYRPDIYLTAAEYLVAEGRIDEAEVPFEADGYRPPTGDFIDGRVYDGRKPIEYLKSFEIGNKP